MGKKNRRGKKKKADGAAKSVTGVQKVKPKIEPKSASMETTSPDKKAMESDEEWELVESS